MGDESLVLFLLQQLTVARSGIVIAPQFATLTPVMSHSRERKMRKNNVIPFPGITAGLTPLRINLLALSIRLKLSSDAANHSNFEQAISR